MNKLAPDASIDGLRVMVYGFGGVSRVPCYLEVRCRDA